jgi:hypothetical protein
MLMAVSAVAFLSMEDTMWNYTADEGNSLSAAIVGTCETEKSLGGDGCDADLDQSNGAQGRLLSFLWLVRSRRRDCSPDRP